MTGIVNSFFKVTNHQPCSCDHLYMLLVKTDSDLELKGQTKLMVSFNRQPHTTQNHLGKQS